MSNAAEPGTIGWIDLTVNDASGVKDFYAAVAGWTAEPLNMGGYSDYVMKPAAGGDAVTGICHARGVNAILPPVWRVYIRVANLDASLRACAARGGKVIDGPRSSGVYGRFAVIQDPAGASAALIEPPA